VPQETGQIAGTARACRPSARAAADIRYLNLFINSMGIHTEGLSIANDAAVATRDQQQAGPCLITIKGVDGSSTDETEPSTCDVHVQLELSASSSSVYSLYSRRRRGLILAVISITQCLAPFNDCIVLPGLKVSVAGCA
jgi:hypothetical protein